MKTARNLKTRNEDMKDVSRYVGTLRTTTTKVSNNLDYLDLMHKASKTTSLSLVVEKSSLNSWSTFC